MPAKFRKRPVVIEAVQLRWDTWSEVCSFAGVGRLADGKPEGCHVNEKGEAKETPWGGPIDELGLQIPTLEGTHLAREGDWIIRGVKGELYPCKAEIFALTYEPVEE
jgi:hypothetical protein